MEFRRFVVLGDSKVIKDFLIKKDLSRDDLIFIYRNLDVNGSLFPEIVKAREVAREVGESNDLITNLVDRINTKVLAIEDLINELNQRLIKLYELDEHDTSVLKHSIERIDLLRIELDKEVKIALSDCGAISQYYEDEILKEDL